MNLSGADIYTDFSGFSRLRAQAREGGEAARREVAEQMEALFVSMMLKSMREAGGALGGGASGVHEGLYDSQLAVSLSKSGRLGFADMLLRQMPGGAGPGEAPAAAPPRDFPAPQRNAALPARDWVAVREVAAKAAPAGPVTRVPGAAGAPPGPAPQATGPARRPEAPALHAAAPAPDGGSRVSPEDWDSPEAFARSLWPAASRAAEALGTSPEAVLAVAALETGWGRHMPARSDGRPSNNLFGIKAHGWGGEVTHAATLEFEHGAFARRVEPFRAYDTPEAAVADFARFVAGQPRYREALASGGDPVRFVRALHAAGYATDPAYGDKLERLVRSAPFKQAAAAADTSIT